MIEKRGKRREGGEGREMVKSEENAPSPPGHACSSCPGLNVFFKNYGNRTFCFLSPQVSRMKLHWQVYWNLVTSLDCNVHNA